jgi:TonB-dependent SusC/RagA subfamily outer membrane receptor
MKKIAISIPTPCHENWQNMNPTEQGRFCLSCKKEVIDFTVMSDAELFRYLLSAKGKNICGSALPSQLGRPIFEPQKTSKPLAWHWNYIMLLLFLFTKSTIKAQTLKGEIISVPIKRDTSTLSAGSFLYNTATNINDTTMHKLKSNPVDSSLTSVPVSIRLGGAVSSYHYSEPLYIVDGKVIKNGALNLDPNDIETVEVIKDASAAAIYGNVASGVIIIKTKTKPARNLYKKIITAFTGPFNIYPNPVPKNSPVNIDMKGVQPGEFLLQLSDVQGQIVQQETIQVPDPKFIFQLSLKNELAAGMYFLRIINPDKKLVYTGKVIVE